MWIKHSDSYVDTDFRDQTNWIVIDQHNLGLVTSDCTTPQGICNLHFILAPFSPTTGASSTRFLSRGRREPI